MKVLVLGSGGREHALCWRILQDKSVTKVFAWPGNPGMDGVSLVQKDFTKEILKEFIESMGISLVIPGAEKFLYQGVSDWCELWGVPCFGPSSQAAKLEQSKIFSKVLMSEASVPTAPYLDISHLYHHDFSGIKKALLDFKKPVIKISGPSLGKGVFVCASPDEAQSVLEEIKKSPLAGLEEGLLVEEALEGEEISLFYACHGEMFTYLGGAQDHKRLLDNDEGPNTGGMGAFSPVGWADHDFIEDCTEKFLRPTLKKMVERKTSFKGVLFLGLMVGKEGSFLLEYNVRFGDPETQVILPLIEGDLTQVLYDLSRGKNSNEKINIKNQTAIHVVKAAKGYPGTFGTEIEKDQEITLTPLSPETLCFFAGVKKSGEALLSSGGRVLGITALGESKKMARDLAYKSLSCARFNGEQFRRDIGGKA